jgi:hypothetical protein
LRGPVFPAPVLPRCRPFLDDQKDDSALNDKKRISEILALNIILEMTDGNFVLGDD